MSNLLFVLSSLLLGWVALWPARRSFDAVLFHVLAIPVGLLSWVAPALVFAALRIPWNAPVMLGSALLAAVAMAVAFRFAAREAGGPAPALWTYAPAFAIPAAVAVWQVRFGFSLAGFDAYGHWEASGMWLDEVGTIESWLMSARALLIPSWQAADRGFGGTWGAAIYPVLAVVLLVLLARLLLVGRITRLPVAARVAFAIGVPALLAATFPFRYHAFLVHTHMAAAVYLLGSVGCLVLAVRDDADRGAPYPLLLASGLLASAFALTRPDTPAYLILPAGVFAALWLTGRVRGAAWFWGGLLVPLWAVYGLAFATLGLWVSPMKLGGKVALLLLLALSSGPLVLAGIRRIPSLVHAQTRPSDVMRVVASAEAVVLLAVLYYVRDTFAAAAGTMVANLFWAGVQGFAWYFATGIVVAAILFPAIRRAVPSGDVVLFSLFQFAVAALAVHATSHPGRVALNDSFNRVSFHALPLVFWYFGLLAATALDVVLAANVREVPAEDGGREPRLEAGA